MTARPGERNVGRIAKVNARPAIAAMTRPSVKGFERGKVGDEGQYRCHGWWTQSGAYRARRETTHATNVPTATVSNNIGNPNETSWIAMIAKTLIPPAC